MIDLGPHGAATVVKAEKFYRGNAANIFFRGKGAPWGAPWGAQGHGAPWGPGGAPGLSIIISNLRIMQVRPN